ncbi:MAG TPA: hypothetical protein VF886_12810, partial [Roseiarcus sp.]
MPWIGDALGGTLSVRRVTLARSAEALPGTIGGGIAGRDGELAGSGRAASGDCAGGDGTAMG